jgi:hypothetical protein
MRKTLIRDGACLPRMVFEAHYKLFRVVDEARVLSGEFVCAILKLSQSIHVDEIALMMMDPDPVGYYYSHFHKYGAIVIETADTPDSVLRLCMSDNDESADPFSVVADTFAMFPISPQIPRWCVYRDRFHYEAGIVGFTDEDAMNTFLEIDETRVAVTPAEAVETFMSIPFWPRHLPPEIKAEFFQNYGTD